jgi:hypothetical protein
VLENGRVVEIGKHADLLERKGVYARLYAVNYGLSQDDGGSIEDNGMSVETPAADN